MSLVDRVKANEPVAQSADFATADALTRLRNRVQDLLPPDVLVQAASSNPIQAKNEIRSTCNRIFEQDLWFAEQQIDTAVLVDSLLNSIFGFGPLQSLLEDESVTEIMVNASHSLYYERAGKLIATDRVFTDDEQVRALIDRIIGPLGRRIDEASPAVNARLPQGHRVHAIIPPLALDGPILTIRKFRSHVMELDEMVAAGSFDETVETFLTWAVLMRKNVAVSGGTGSGKTTLLNALSCKIPYTERIITIEDSAELRFLNHPHVVRLEARPASMEGAGEVTIRDLVINALRMRPDRIVVGECRGAEALDMLQAMNTGHDGSLTTLHANTPADAVTRLTTMVRYAVDLPVEVIEAQIASAIDLIVQTARASDGSRYVSDIVSCEYDRATQTCKLAQVFRHDRIEEVKRWSNIPAWVDQLDKVGLSQEGEVESWLRCAS